MKLYSKIDEIEKELNSVFPPIVYKYRDWENGFHKKIITNREIYYAHPHELNDPEDVRPPINFIVGNISKSELRKKVTEAGRSLNSSISERALKIQVENRVESIINDPKGYYQQNLEDLNSDKSQFDKFGVLSLCSKCNNEHMWEDYANYGKGFAIGFESLKLFKVLNCIIGHVDYTDIPIDFKIFGINKDFLTKVCFQKKSNWQIENEIRFLTARISQSSSRLQHFPQEIVPEIILGPNISKLDKDEILFEANKSLPLTSVYQLERNLVNGDFTKVKLR